MVAEGLSQVDFEFRHAPRILGLRRWLLEHLGKVCYGPFGFWQSCRGRLMGQSYMQSGV